MSDVTCCMIIKADDRIMKQKISQVAVHADFSL
jgi:hypothetical protein